MLGEVAGYANDLDSMHQALSKATDILDSLNANHKDEVSPITLASMYHKVASSYMTQSIESCLPLLEKSLQILPNFIPALKDRVYIYVVLVDRTNAQLALDQLRYHASTQLHPIEEDIVAYQLEIDKLES